MKTMKMLLIGFLLISATFLTESCLKGKGDVVSKTFDVETFSGISNCISADIHITQSPVQSVEIIAQPNITSNISLKVSNGVLIIKFRKNAVRYDPIIINISMSELSSLDISGSGNMNTTNTFDSCGTVSMDISGSGSIDAFFNSGSRTYSNISGSGNIKLTGTSPRQDITISGSGSVHTFPFHTYHAFVNISGSGSCELTADSTLHVVISGSGSVYYKGHPDINSTITGSGTIHDSN